MTSKRDLKEQVERQAERISKAEREQATLIAQTVYIGSLGLMFILPVVGGAFLGHWIDGLMAGYSVRWTVSLILLGIALGGVNVYLSIKD